MKSVRAHAAVETSRRNQLRAIFNIKLRSVTILVALIGLGLQIGVACKSADYYEFWISPESFAFLALSLGWNITELVVRFVRKRGIHPGAHVALDLILWMGLFSASLLQLLINSWDALPIVAGVTKIICCVLHFVLFVYSCVDCDRRRKKSQLEAVAKAVIELKDNQQFELSHIGTVQDLPQGMALISIETLAKLQNSVCAKCAAANTELKG